MSIIPSERIEKLIFLIRGQKVMIDRDLAQLYGVETRVLVQAMKRNMDRFPEDFAFQLSSDEFRNWKSQIVISNPEVKMGLRKRSYVFTEQGVAMLASVLKSKQAVQVNIAIVRTFVHLRKIMASHHELFKRIESLEKQYEEQFKIVFDAIRKLIKPPTEQDKKRGIGFKLK